MAKTDPCYGKDNGQIRMFLDRYGSRLVDLPEIVERVDRRRAGQDWPGMDSWIANVGPRWVNDPWTVVFEVPLETLVGPNCLEFAQDVWMFGLVLFEYLVENGQGVVRMEFPKGLSSCQPPPSEA